jgi:CBS domain-containing protein
METDEPKFVQSAPQVVKPDLSEEKMIESSASLGGTRIGVGWGKTLKEEDIDADADSFLSWIVRYPVERNHPRPTTSTISVKKSGDAVVCMANDKLSDVLQLLIVEGYLSVPVLSQVKQLLGFIDLLDIVWYCLWSFGAWREEVSSERVIESRQHFSTFLSLERFRNATILDVLGRPGFGTRNAIHHVFKGFSLFHVFETMARLSCHRVAICNAERKVTGLITQSMVISLLDQHLDKLGTLASKHDVQEIIPGLGDELRLIHEDDLALSAFKAMVTGNVSGLAVINKTGELTDSISVRDLRGMGVNADDWTALWMNVKEFKAHCRKKFPSQTPSKPIFVKKTDSLEKVIRLMDDGNIHRVFVCQESEGQGGGGMEGTGKRLIPSHVITQRDVMRFILHLCGLKSTGLEDLERAQELL